jgi:hypothetical protein
MAAGGIPRVGYPAGRVGTSTLLSGAATSPSREKGQA